MGENASYIDVKRANGLARVTPKHIFVVRGARFHKLHQAATLNKDFRVSTVVDPIMECVIDSLTLLTIIQIQ